MPVQYGIDAFCRKYESIVPLAYLGNYDIAGELCEPGATGGAAVCTV